MKYILIFLNIVLTGGYMVMLKKYANDSKNHPMSLTLYNIFAYSISGIILGGTYFIGNTWSFDPIVWYAFFGGVFANLGSYPYMMAMPKAPGSVIQPLLGMTYPLIAIGGLCLFHEPITIKVVLGILSGVIAIYLFNS